MLTIFDYFLIPILVFILVSPASIFLKEHVKIGFYVYCLLLWLAHVDFLSSIHLWGGPVAMLKYWFFHRFIYIVAPLALKNADTKFSSLKIFESIFFVLGCFALYMTRHFRTTFGGYVFNWSGITVYCFFTATLIWILKRKGVKNLHAFLIAFFSVAFLSEFYELKLILDVNPLILASSKFLVSALMIVYFLAIYKWTPRLATLTALAPTLISWLFYPHFQLWPYGALARALPATFMLSLHLGLQDPRRKLVENRCQP